MSEPHEGVDALYDPGEVGRLHHNRLDRFIVSFSNWVAWLFPALMVAICVQVVLRNAGRMGVGPGNQAWMDDLQWWIYGMAVLVGIAYATTTNSHVRVDIFYDHFSDRRKARIDIFALSWLFLPFVIMCFDMTIHYAISSVASDEGSSSPNGLHNLWVLKIGMAGCFVVMIIAAWGAYVRRLGSITEPVLWRKLLWAFPSTMYVFNLLSFYAIWWWIKLTARAPDTGEALRNRDVSRHDFFDPLEFGVHEMPKTILIAAVLSVLAILLARLMAGRAKG